jgi:hypothetical protein
MISRWRSMPFPECRSEVHLLKSFSTDSSVSRVPGSNSESVPSGRLITELLTLRCSKRNCPNHFVSLPEYYQSARSTDKNVFKNGECLFQQFYLAYNSKRHKIYALSSADWLS